MPFFPPTAICVKQTPGKGLGVFATRDIRLDELIERCPILVLTKSEVLESGPLLPRYVFSWGRGKVALALGYGSIYNHSYEPNAYYEDRGRRCKQYRALRDISAGEEITINYNGVGTEEPVGFEVID